MITMKELIARAQKSLDDAITLRGEKQAALLDLRDKLENGAEVSREAVAAAAGERDQADAAVREAQAKLEEYEAEAARDAEIAELRSHVVETESRAPKYDQVVRVGREERTYRPDHDPKGKGFLRDFLGAEVLNQYDSRARLARHMQEETRERGEALTRAAGTGAFAGLVVPQYLTELYAPKARAARPFANACRSHDLPAEGNTVNISRITTGTSTAIRADETSDVSETDIDDTLLTVNVQENAGSQSLTRKAVMRGTGVEDVTLEDLFSAYNTTLDSTLLNQATNGLAAVATGITYTSGSPTAAELYPKVVGGISAVEAALINQDPNGTAAVMHSRRWYWMQSQLSSTFPLIAQPYGLGFNAGGVNNAEGYGDSVRGFLPNGTPVIVDNNVVTNAGAGTNQDDVYLVSLPECHLWEDATAPMLLRTDTGPNMKKNMIDIVVFGFFAYTFVRQSHAQRINGTGLVSPSF